MALLLQGAHRGGTRFVERATRKTFDPHGDHLVVADPMPGRAAALAASARERFPALRTTPLAVPGRQALGAVGADDPVVLASDTVGSLRDTLGGRRPSQPALWQVVGRGPGGGAGVRLGLQGTLLPGDRGSEAGTQVLLETLEHLAPPASSRAMTRTDALAGTVLAPMRELALGRTLRHLDEMEREPADLSGGPLGIVTGRLVVPLRPVEVAEDATYRQRKEIALETLERIPERQLLDRGVLGRYGVVALVAPTPSTIHFMTLVRSRQDRRRVEGLVAFAPQPVAERAPGPTRAAAAGVLAAAAAAAVFTD
ncbi:MAG: hypothetical protein AB1505_33325 [Candidatus Latescibacterota bacterium]